MKDYNFFEIYNKKQKGSFNKKSPVFILGTVLLILVIIAAGLIVRNLVLNQKIKNTYEKLEIIKATEEYQEAAKIQQGQAAMTKYNEKASVTLQKLDDAKIVNTSLLSSINSKVPEGISMSNMYIDSNIIQIICTAQNRKAISEFQLRLKELPFVGDAYVNSITKNITDTKFTAKIECLMVREVKSK